MAIRSMSINKQPLLQLINVTKGYFLGGTEFKAVKPTNLSVYPGDYISVRGPSGSGKSTLMHLMGLLDTPTTGKDLFWTDRMSPAYPKQNWPRSETAKSDLYFSSLIFCPELQPGKMWLCRWFMPEFHQH